MGELHGHKRALAQIRRYIWPVRDLVNFLLHEEGGLVTKATKVYLRDCYDHTVQLMDLVESYRDVLSGLMELYLSAVGIRTNEIMRVLTVISSIFIPLTFIAGVYGMNFAHEADGKKLPWNMPELYQPDTSAFGFMLTVFQIVLFKKSVAVAKGAISLSLGQRLRFISKHSAESAIHSGIDLDDADIERSLKRAFSAGLLTDQILGRAPG